MIYQLNGKVEGTSPGLAIVDVNGVGYGVFMPERLMGEKIKEGDQLRIFTVTIVSQDDLRLFGFLSRQQMFMTAVSLTLKMLLSTQP